MAGLPSFKVRGSKIPPPKVLGKVGHNFMRARIEIQKDGTRVDMLALEVLLDIRELLKMGKIIPQIGKKPYTGKPRGRPKKIK